MNDVTLARFSDGTQPPARVDGGASSMTVTSARAVATCRDQFAGLLASSHPRCGALSPARAVAANSPLMHSWWRAWVLGPARPFVLALEPCPQDTPGDAGEEGEEGDWPGPSSLTVWFRVSPATLGVFGGLREMARPGDGDADSRWVAPDACVSEGSEGGRSSMDVLRPPSMARVACVADNLGKFMYDVNAKWLVMLEFPHCGNGEWLTVKSMEPSRGAGGCGDFCGAEAYAGVSVPYSLRPTEGYHDYMIMNPANPDEALIMTLEAANRVSFVLVDVAQTHATHRLVVLCSTRCSLPPQVTHIAPITRKRNGDVVFVVTSRSITPPSSPVFWIEASTGASTMMTPECTSIAQVSSSLFSLWFRDPASSSRVELWDCNDAAKPLRVVDCTGLSINRSNQLPQVVGGTTAARRFRGRYLIPAVCDLGLQVCVISCDAARQHIIIASVSYKWLLGLRHSRNTSHPQSPRHRQFLYPGLNVLLLQYFRNCILMGNMIGGFTPINSIKHYILPRGYANCFSDPSCNKKYAGMTSIRVVSFLLVADTFHIPLDDSLVVQPGLEG
ncbi:hypothetical protein Pelo_8473 [Pelomyxa schiedti]|nr:hypothetical protein Pelo_8473 [Pelomyxa schiedti]